MQLRHIRSELHIRAITGVFIKQQITLRYVCFYILRYLCFLSCIITNAAFRRI